MATLKEVFRFVAAHGGWPDGVDIDITELHDKRSTATVVFPDGASLHLRSWDNAYAYDTEGYGCGAECEIWGEVP